jgi:hypothetical protein
LSADLKDIENPFDSESGDDEEDSEEEEEDDEEDGDDIAGEGEL